MLVLHDYRCNSCNAIKESLEETGTCTIRCQCGSTMNIAFTKSNLSSECDFFNPHYDLQLGQYFESASHKKAYLKKIGKTQVEGSFSPKDSGRGRYLVTKDQAKSVNTRTDVTPDEWSNVERRKIKGG